MRHQSQQLETELRAYLIEQAENFRMLMTTTMLGDGPESARYTFDECSKTVDALSAGKEVRVHGWELPSSHWARVYGVGADWILTENDELVEASRERAVP